MPRTLQECTARVACNRSQHFWVARPEQSGKPHVLSADATPPTCGHEINTILTSRGSERTAPEAAFAEGLLLHEELNSVPPSFPAELPGFVRGEPLLLTAAYRFAQHMLVLLESLAMLDSNPHCGWEKQIENCRWNFHALALTYQTSPAQAAKRHKQRNGG